MKNFIIYRVRPAIAYILASPFIIIGFIGELIFLGFGTGVYLADKLCGKDD